MNKTFEYPHYPTHSEHPEGLTEAIDKWYRDIANLLPNDAIESLVCLVRHGPVYDGDIPSKIGRDELLDLDLAAKIVVSGHAMPNACYRYIKPPPLLSPEELKPGFAWGYQAATYRGAYVYKALIEIGRVKP